MKDLRNLRNPALVKELDKQFSIFVRKSNRIGYTQYVRCATCRTKTHWKQMDCGHFISRAKFPTRWEERNCLPQCKACNIFKQGQQYQMSQEIDRRFGKGTAELMLIKSRNFWKPMRHELIALIEEYRTKNKTLP